MKKIVVTGGGTLGHVMPNLYLMEELKDFSSVYIGSNGIEKGKLREVGVEYREIPAIKLRRGKIFVNLKIPFVLIGAIFKAKKMLKEISPDVVFSKGGYVSLPVCVAAKMLRIPVIAHESDFSMGLANKIILKVCDVMCVNFKHEKNRNKKIVYTGPIFGKNFEDKHKVSGLNLDEKKSTILIVGGSLGSKKINQLILSVLGDLLNNFNIIHITGKGNMLRKSYDNYNAFEMSSDMAGLYNMADFIIGRSGAGVSAEGFYKKLPMILIPLENGASRGDQIQNARYYEKLGVAKIVREPNLTAKALLNEVNDFAKNIGKYREAYKRAEQPNGKEKVKEIILKYAGGENKKNRR